MSEDNTKKVLYSVKCTTCDGRGRVGIPRSPYEVMPDCPTCDGGGFIDLVSYDDSISSVFILRKVYK